MFGYAPQRHRLPLIRSATSASVSAGSPSVTRLGQPAAYSASAPTAEQTCPGRAVAALERVPVQERLLHRVQPVRAGQSLDGGDLGAVQRDGEREAAQRAAAVDQHGAGTALPVVAALLRSGQAQVLTQRVEQCGAGVQGQGSELAVDLQRDLREASIIGHSGEATPVRW